jgi:hypothetical protein
MCQSIDAAYLVHMSLSFELIFDCVNFFAATCELEQTTSLHRSKDAPCLGVTKGTMPSCPPHFFEIFQKNSDNFVETNRTSERFFDRNSNSRKVKMMACVRWRVAIHPKLLVLTPPRLQHEDLRVLL